jgi:hypothetical protein
MSSLTGATRLLSSLRPKIRGLLLIMLAGTLHADGGPDSFGYTWLSNTDSGGPAFQWVDISQLGTPLQVGESGYAGPFALDFPFPFYGQFHSSCFVTANGLISFGGASGTAMGQCLPNAATPNGLIALLWEDLHPVSGGSVRVWQDTENPRLIIQFNQILGACGQSCTAQAILLPGGVITLQYQNLPAACAAQASIGIESADGGSGLSFHCPQGGELATAGLALQFLPPTPCDELVCDGQAEEEPNNGWEDGFSNPIAGGQVRCGSLHANPAGVDRDAFLYRHFGGNMRATLATEDFNGRLTLCQAQPGGTVVATADQLPRCYNEEVRVMDLPVGLYLLVVEHSGEPDVEGEQAWSLTLSCDGHACSSHAPVQCVGQPEAEPNEGWMADPPNSSLGWIQPGQQVCGSIQADGASRDMDWFQLHLNAPADLEMELSPDAFDAVLYFTDLDPSGSVWEVADDWRLCMPEHLRLDNMAAGDYCVVVSSQLQELVPEAQNYVLHVTVADSSALCQAMPLGSLDGVDMLELHGALPLAHHNGGAGCADGPAAAGRDEVYSFQLESGTLVANLRGAGDADESLFLYRNCLDAEGSCVAVADDLGAGPEGEILDLHNLEAGDYWLVADFAESGGEAPFDLVLWTVEVDVAPHSPMGFQLEIPHPNPFNPRTVLNWSQAEAGPARLDVHDLRGALVDRRELGWLPAGRHQVEWDAAQRPAGLYLFTMEVRDDRQSRKALLLK